MHASLEIAAEMDHGNMLGITGCRSISALIGWKTGSTTANAKTIAAIAHRLPQFPLRLQGMREGRLSLDQVGTIAKKAADGSDEPYREPNPDPTPEPEPELPPQLTKTGSDDQYVYWKVALSHLDAATFDAAVASHLDAAIAEYKRDHDDDDLQPEHRRPFPTKGSAFMALVESGWDTDAAARPHGQRTTVVAHLDVKDQIAQLHLGPLLCECDRQYLSCDATCEVWFERDGQPLGAGRTTRTISRRLRRALEYRHPTCAVPGCAATRGLHAHHIIHWENGGATELDNLVLVCPYHHRAHHRGELTITGPAPHITVTDTDGKTLTSASLARPPNHPPPDAPPYPGPIGERAQWKWYDPYEPKPPTDNN